MHLGPSTHLYSSFWKTLLKYFKICLKDSLHLLIHSSDAHSSQHEARPNGSGNSTWFYTWVVAMPVLSHLFSPRHIQRMYGIADTQARHSDMGCIHSKWWPNVLCHCADSSSLLIVALNSFLFWIHKSENSKVSCNSSYKHRVYLQKWDRQSCKHKLCHSKNIFQIWLSKLTILYCYL